ncbi:MAG: TonB-dependent receptor, partial [Rhodothermales bacterium]|nr:TonB-dependent receptor [Rhodothermales bacterium]
MNRTSRIGALLLLAGLLVPAAFAQRATLTGTVTDATDGSPLPGANIVVTEPGATAMIGGAATGIDGTYTVAGLAAGTYTATFRFVGYGEVQRSVTLAAGETATLDVALSQEGFDLDAVVVTASRRQEKVLDAPASISVLGAREIEQNVGTSSIEALKTTTGVDMAQTGIDRREVVLRGFNNAFSGATYVLTDYRQAAVPSLGVNIYSIMPNMNVDVERVEVVRGPGSALYGAGVDAGVIHFITKDPFQHPGVTVAVSGGERSFFNVQGRVAGVVGDNLGLKLTGQYGQADDFELDPDDPLDAEQLEGDRITPRRNDFEKINVNGSAEYRIDDETALILNGGYSALTSTVLSGIGTVQADGFGYTYGQVRFQRGPFFAQVYGNFNDAGDSFVYDSGVSVIDNGALYNAQAQYDFTFLDGREQLIVGVDAELIRPDTEGTIVGRNEDDDSIDEYGVYAQSTTQLSPMFDLTLGLRGDYNNVVEELQFSPRAALVFKVNPTNTVRATYNRAFSSPGTNSNFLDIRAAVNPVGGGNNLVFMGRGAAGGFTFDTFRASQTAAFSLGVPGFFGQAVPVAGVPLAPIYAAFASQIAAVLTDPNGTDDVAAHYRFRGPGKDILEVAGGGFAHGLVDFLDT